MIQSDMKQGVMGWKKVKHIAPTGWKHDKVPLFWNERKGPDFWRSLIASMDIGAVVHLGAGLALPLACMTTGTLYVGLAANKDQKEFLYSCLTDAAERHLSGRPCLWEELRDLEPTMDDDDAIQDDELSCGSGDGSDSDSD